MSFTEPYKAKTYFKGQLQGKCMFNALKAMEICFKYHKGFRKDGTTPEWFHQLSIALYLSTLEGSLGQYEEDLYVVAFLHDVVEDYDYPLQAVEDDFGSVVMRAVAAISKKNSDIFKKSPPDYYNDISGNTLASIVKGADRIHNFQSMSGVFTAEKQLSYIEEAKTYILPMLKQARNSYPVLRPAYENIKHVLMMQMALINGTLKLLAE